MIIHTDGGARGNPGPAAIGVVIEKDKKIIAEIGKTIGETTNNVAEYTAVIIALTYLKDHKNAIGAIQFYLDSTLVVNQINGVFKIKQDHLRKLLEQVHALEKEIGESITYSYVPRDQNKEADRLVNSALDLAHVA